MDIISLKEHLLDLMEEAKLPMKEELVTHHVPDLAYQRFLAGQVTGLTQSQTIIQDYFKQLIGRSNLPEEKKAIY